MDTNASFASFLSRTEPCTLEYTSTNAFSAWIRIFCSFQAPPLKPSQEEERRRRNSRVVGAIHLSTLLCWDFFSCGIHLFKWGKNAYFNLENSTRNAQPSLLNIHIFIQYIYIYVYLFNTRYYVLHEEEIFFDCLLMGYLGLFMQRSRNHLCCCCFCYCCCFHRWWRRRDWCCCCYDVQPRKDLFLFV